MKTIKLSTEIAIIIIALMVASCSKEGDQSNNLTKDQVENNLQNDTWIITFYFDSDKDETNHFAGYSFVFKPNLEIIATNTSSTFTGAWSINDSSSGDDSMDDLHFNILFNVGNDLDELNDDWEFISQSPTEIKLTDVSGGNGGVDFLTFTKN